MNERRPTYVPSPQVPAEIMPRLEAIVCVLAGLKSVSEAARALGISRNHFQTILHRSVQQLMETVSVKPGGRPARPSQVTQLQEELHRLKRQNTRLQRQVEATEQLLTVTGNLLRGRIRPGRHRSQGRKAKNANEQQDDGDPEGRRTAVLAGVDEMHRLGMTYRAAAPFAGVDAATMRRWRASVRSPHRQVCRTRKSVTPAVVERTEQLVRCMHGLVGAGALSHSIEGLPRRAAAAIKAHVLTSMERERKAVLKRVVITQPGVLRGLDAMHFTTEDAPLFAIIMGDGAVPYRTTLKTANRYDGELVVNAISEDLDRNGAPLVLRMDRARAHATAEVQELLDRNGVMVLQGPPHYPRFYGQLERQNREHRAWMALAPRTTSMQTVRCLEEMLRCVNCLWRRCTLGWKTATEVWNARTPLAVDRDAFREEVDRCTHSIARTLESRGDAADLAGRLAIERTLERMGYLRQEIGGWC